MVVRFAYLRTGAEDTSIRSRSSPENVGRKGAHSCSLVAAHCLLTVNGQQLVWVDGNKEAIDLRVYFVACKAKTYTSQDGVIVQIGE